MIINYLANYLIKLQKSFIYSAICIIIITLILNISLYFIKNDIILEFVIMNVLFYGFFACGLILISDLARSVKANYRIAPKIFYITAVHIVTIAFLTIVLTINNIIILFLLTSLIVCLVFYMKYNKFIHETHDLKNSNIQF